MKEFRGCEAVMCVCNGDTSKCLVFYFLTVLLGLFCGILLEMFAMAEAKFVM